MCCRRFCAGEATKLVSGGQVVSGRKLSFINDLTVTQDGKKVYFTDSSSRWQRKDYMHLIMEATADGRYDRINDSFFEIVFMGLLPVLISKLNTFSMFFCCRDKFCKMSLEG